MEKKSAKKNKKKKHELKRGSVLDRTIGSAAREGVGGEREQAEYGLLQPRPVLIVCYSDMRGVGAAGLIPDNNML